MMNYLLLLLELQLLQWPTPSSSFSIETQPIAKPNCSDLCGSIQIPFPFGIGHPYCYYNKSYELSCNSSFDPPKLFLLQYNLQVLDINWNGRYSRTDNRSMLQESSEQLITVVTSAIRIWRNDSANTVTDTAPLTRGYDFRNSPYLLMSWRNVLMAHGCGGNVVLKDTNGEILAGCASLCPTGAADNVSRTSCHGVGCCQAEFASSFDSFHIEVECGEAPGSYPCTMVAGLVQTSFAGKSPSNFSAVPTVLDWKGPIPNNCISYNEDTQRCSCDYPWEGNAFLPGGCKVPRACHKCKDNCKISSEKGYYCVNFFLKLSTLLGFGISIGLVILLLGCYGLYRVIKRRREIKRKAKYFKRNGGLLLQQASCSEHASGKTKIFGITELERATGNFNKNRILGQGGQGTVYKGMLTDGKIVAIKKAKQIDESQLEQFVNELVILSQINHRNVVKLLGCCLETEVPLLVYEFIPNGTLYKHIHDPSEDFHVTWKMRLQIAAESADALAYLHSSSSTPIYHRDIKSSNILLDGKYRAKVSDFGASRAITIDQTHVTTRVLGTYGYLDPEYFQSNQFTEKSDVYSFGVVLVELMTGEKPIRPTSSGGWISLASEFLLFMENSRVYDFLDKRVLEEVKYDEFIAVANLAKRCLSMQGRERPTMKEMAESLDKIKSPYSSDAKESGGETKQVTDKGDVHSAAFNKNLFFSEINRRTRSSSKVQLPISNTL